MPGFEVNRFVGLDLKLRSHLICSICEKIYDNAVTSDCGHTFCKSCVENWINYENRNCPNCWEPLTTKSTDWSDSLDSKEVIIDGFPFVRNLNINDIISELKIKCDFESNGCKELIQLSLLSDHIKSCKHKKRCESCDFAVSTTEWFTEDHNCLQNLKNGINEWKLKYKSSESRVKELENRLSDIESKDGSERDEWWTSFEEEPNDGLWE